MAPGGKRGGPGMHGGSGEDGRSHGSIRGAALEGAKRKGAEEGHEPDRLRWNRFRFHRGRESDSQTTASSRPRRPICFHQDRTCSSASNVCSGLLPADWLRLVHGVWALQPICRAPLQTGSKRLSKKSCSALGEQRPIRWPPVPCGCRARPPRSNYWLRFRWSLAERNPAAHAVPDHQQHRIERRQSDEAPGHHTAGLVRQVDWQ